jgi:hypothetical protein
MRALLVHPEFPTSTRVSSMACGRSASAHRCRRSASSRSRRFFRASGSSSSSTPTSGRSATTTSSGPTSSSSAACWCRSRRSGRFDKRRSSGTVTRDIRLGGRPCSTRADAQIGSRGCWRRHSCLRLRQGGVYMKNEKPKKLVLNRTTLAKVSGGAVSTGAGNTCDCPDSAWTWCGPISCLMVC